VEISKKKPSPDDADATDPQHLPIDQESKPNLALDYNQDFPPVAHDFPF
jgi:hypothetical protein